MTLDELGLKYGTDKASNWHNYLRVYSRYLEPIRETAKSVLEIGVQTGASIQMWRDYFANAHVTGVDIDPKSLTSDFGNQVSLILGDAGNPDFWKSHSIKCFDLIIDDGAHKWTPIREALIGAWPMLNPGGFYIVEDLHCAFHPVYCQPGVSGEQDGRWAVFMDWIQQMTKGLPNDCGDATKSPCDIAFMHFYRSLLIIGKK